MPVSWLGTGRFAAAGGFTTITDSFDRADSATTMGNTDTGQTWVPNHGTWGIVSNTAYLATNSGDNQHTTVVQSGVSDCTISVVLSTFVQSTGMGICARSTDNNNHFLVGFAHTPSSTELYRREAGSFNLLGSAVRSMSSGDTIEMVLSGTSVKVKHNGTEIISVTSSFNQSATKHGLRVFNSTSPRFNNFSITVP